MIRRFVKTYLNGMDVKEPQAGQNGLTAELLSGLQEGERVIAHPDDAVKDGTRIAPTE